MDEFFGTIPDNGWFHWIVSNKYVCFHCRKVWRPYRWVKNIGSRTMSVCPQCANPVVRVYPMFKAPKRRDTKAWKRLRKRVRGRT